MKKINLEEVRDFIEAQTLESKFILVVILKELELEKIGMQIMLWQ